MRLSEAIRSGAARGLTQICGEYNGYGDVDENNNLIVTHACAFGAALVATGDAVGDENALWPWIEKVPASCPIEGCNGVAEEGGPVKDVQDVVFHLNDDHHWTFDQIADWVQVQEALNGLGEQAAEPAVRHAVPTPEPANAG